MEENSNYSFLKEIVTNTVRLRLLSNDIIHYTFLPNSEVNEIEHQSNHNALIELVGNSIKYPLLIDGDDFANVTPEGRKLIRQLEPLIPISARAIVIKILGQRILANFYIRFQKPIIPTKVFNDYEEALEWLEKYK